MASKILTSFLLLILYLVSLSDASLTSISAAVEVLCDSGYFSMGLTLQLANKDLRLDDWQELTIFAPSDRAFSQSGQPSLLSVKYHLSPTRLPGETLTNLPHGAKIPTIRSNSSLTVTNSSRSGGGLILSINGVAVQDSPLFDDGYVVIYSSDEFFTPPIVTPPSPPPAASIDSISVPIPSSAPVKSKPVNCFNIFESASSLLLSRGFVIMATFLALQLEISPGNDTTKLTVFAPIDEAVSVAKFSDYATIFRGHVIKRLLSWKDLEKLAWEGSILQTALRGYEMELSWSGDFLLLNGVPLVFPDLYADEWVVVHGVNQMIAPRAGQGKVGESISELNGGGEGEEEDDVHGEFSTELGDSGLH
ncbi:putative fasciclin-like arabinogalactan protein 20 [Raphanus sativus]|uniref:Fasciclin-like arabinogalactan protein 20 n=1 Tax=Raphanus sativus TaxID=3726 RepID=A0A6J0N2E0_RAPSA|nr:putative fasciclin-like arabinogalactan protein 20 [Raphanus sativus]KAJ4902536.1 putative fasciclin-like arabinogalactan protein 20 [Raphanus sativus]